MNRAKPTETLLAALATLTVALPLTTLFTPTAEWFRPSLLLIALVSLVGMGARVLTTSRLLVIGAGAMAPFLARAHASVRPISRIRIWNRTAANADRIARELASEGFDAEAVTDLDPEIGRADIISTATISPTALIRGELLSPGTHVDLVGAFTPEMRESDDEAVLRSRVYVDTRAGALQEAGDLVQPLADGTLVHEDVVGELAELCRGEVTGRQGADEITLFKSVGAAIEDLAGGIAVYRSVADR